MSRRRVIRLAAAPEEVRNAARRALSARDVEDSEVGDLRIPLADDDESTYVQLHLTPEGDGATLVSVESHNGLQLPFFGWAIRPLVGIALRRFADYVPVALGAAVAGEPVPDPPAEPSFLPIGAFDADQAAHLSTAAGAAALVGFAAALFGQLADPVQQSFHVSDSGLGVALAVTRFGALVAFVVAGFADRRGRRRAILVGLWLSVAASAVSAIAPTFVVFTGAQLVQRAAFIATATVAGIAVIEEAPEGARAFSASMLALAGGFGFTFAVLAVPVADIAPWAWRLAFGAGAATAIVIPRIARNLRESTRYTRLASRNVERGRLREVFDQSYRRRIIVLAAAAFLLNVFAAPSSQLTNKYLSDERGFSGADIAVWRGVTTALPGILGLLLAGHLSELRGRRRVMSVGLAIGIATQMVVYLTGGVWLWVGNTAAAIAGSAGSVALGTVEAEMFPTGTRGTSNAMLIIVSVGGSALGLLIAGSLSDRIGLGHALAWCGIGAFFAALFLLPLLPESAQRLLDDVSPTDLDDE